MHHLLRTARVYAQTLFDVVVLGTGTDHIAMDPERTPRADGSRPSEAYR
jgi:hypothetical protein